MSRSSDTRVAAIGRSSIGPVTRTRECEHGGLLFPIDPGVRHVTPCDREAVVDVPIPRKSAIGNRAFCAFHFARFLAAWSDEIEADLRERFDIDEHLPDATFVELEDAPDEIEIERRPFYRIGLDQSGAAHYERPGAATIVVVTAESDGFDYAFHTPPDGSTPRWFRHVRDRRGWAAFDPRATPDALEGSA